MTKKILKWIGNTITVFLVILIVFSFYSAIQTRRNPSYITSIIGYKPMTVLSGSMSPAIEAGDMIVVRQVNIEYIEVGDVITFWASPGTIVTHRVVKIIADNGQVLFKTKGDANNTEDQALVTQDQIIGTLVFRIPYGGYIANFIRTLKGFIVFVVLPVLFLIGGEIKNIIKELNKDKKILKNS